MKMSLPLMGQGVVGVTLASVLRSLARAGWAWTLGALLLVYAATNFLVPRLGQPALETYLLRPVLWLALLGLVVWLWRREAGHGAFPRPAGLIIAGALLGVLQVAVVVLLGLAFGFGNSPLAREWYRVLLNLWFAGTQLAGFEFTRWYLVRGLGRKSPAVGLLVTWPLFALLAVAPAAFSQLGQASTAFSFGGGTLLPAIAQSLLATFLASLGGPLPALLYTGLPQLFEWVSPILPNLSWLVTAFAGTLLPIIGLMVVLDSFVPGQPAPSAASKPAKREGASAVAWVVLAVFATGLVFFNTGVFGVRPSLISGYSMKPTLMAGDIVVTRDVDPASLQVGDVVRYHRDGIDVIHRVKAMQTGTDGQLILTTRGDNNNVDDAPVPAALVQGKLVLTVPKLGWVIIPLHNGLAWVVGLLHAPGA